MEESPENGKELPLPAPANGMNEWIIIIIVVVVVVSFVLVVSWISFSVLILMKLMQL
jgi:hypothetical protein